MRKRINFSVGKKQRSVLLFLAILAWLPVIAQHSVSILVTDSSSKLPIPSALVLNNGKAIGATDVDGKANILCETGAAISVHVTGYFQKTLVVTGTETQIHFLMKSLSPQLEVITISTTRNNSRIDDTPTKIEVLGQEETGEENGIKPGNVSSLLGDLSSIQLQNTNPASGQMSIRIQGLDGRYTQVLRDGLPVYDGFAGSFGVLQLPPLGLKQIELIKGPASTLYGGGAIAGLVNFVSRTPSDTNDLSVTANVSSLLEENLNFWNSGKFAKRSGYTFFLAGTNAKAIDVNSDGFSDVPQVGQLIAHVRYFFDPNKNTSLIFGIDGSIEQREGGDMAVLRSGSDSVHRFFETNTSDRVSSEFQLHHAFTDSSFFDIKASSTIFARGMNSENGRFNGDQFIHYAEMTRSWSSSRQNLVLGINVFISHFEQGDPFLQGSALLIDQKTVGLFLQHTWSITDKITLESGIRGDYYLEHQDAKEFFLPRFAFLWKWNDRTGLRLSAGMGYKTANALTLVPDDHQLALYTFHSTTALKTENSIGGTIDVYWRRRLNEETSLYMNQSFFLTQVDHPVQSSVNSSFELSFINESKPLLTYGSDSYIRMNSEKIELYLGYTWTNALRTYDPIHDKIPLTPQHRVSFVALYEVEDQWRVGIEGSWLSAQFRDNGSKTDPYFFGALMLAYERKHFTFVLNSEDVLNILQSHFEPLYTGSIISPQFNPVWAPIDGRVINLSVRYKL